MRDAATAARRLPVMEAQRIVAPGEVLACSRQCSGSTPSRGGHRDPLPSALGESHISFQSRFQQPPAMNRMELRAPGDRQGVKSESLVR
jgi:hypothetical protein